MGGSDCQAPVQFQNVWGLLALPDEQLEQLDLIEVNLIVAKEIPQFHTLDVDRYREIISKWVNDFTQWLRNAELRFHQTPKNWESDLHFFRVGMMAGWLGNVVGIRYREDQRYIKSIKYTDPTDLFVNGVMDTLRGTCCNMSVLHVAMCRKMGWPVSLACANAHLFSRFDDGKVVWNVDATTDAAGGFNSESDAWYAKKYSLPRKAIDCGSDLRSLTAREMIAVFISLRARYFRDTGNWAQADIDYSLCRAIFPKYRFGYSISMVPFLKRGQQLFNENERGHPKSLIDGVAGPVAAARTPSSGFGMSSNFGCVFDNGPIHKPRTAY